MTFASFIQWLDAPPRPPLVMGILNVTPDSFSDGGQFLDAQQAVARARQMIDQGADIIDIGGESTRPGARRISAEEQIKRILPVIRGVSPLNVAISVDTTRSRVAQAALDAGANIVNDISAGREDPEIVPLVARRGCPVILMHIQGEPGTMQNNPTYTDVVAEVRDHLLERAGVFQSAGVDRRRILIDPGIGFGKTVDHSLLLLKHLDQLAQTGYPVLIGTSRKSFIGKILDLPVASERLHGANATIAWAIANGAAVVRVHDVEPAGQTVRMIRAIMAAGD